MDDDLVSVIIPTYKRSVFLERAINSVLKQTYKPIEIIVVDDNDSNSYYRENTKQIMIKYENLKNVIYIQHNRNKNGSAARNTGIKASRGKYIAFLDDDDEFLQNKLERQIAVLKSLPENFGAVYGGYNVIRGSKIISYKIPQKSGKLTSELLQMSWGTGSGSNVLFKKEVFDRIGLYDESLRRHQDWDILLRMFRFYSIYPIKEILLNIYKDSRINIPNADEFVQIKKHFLFKFEHDIKKLKDEEIKNIYKMHLLEIVSAYLKIRNYKSAWKYYKKAKRYKNISVKQRITLLMILVFFIIPKKEKFLIYFGNIIEKIRMIKS